ncbi:caspase, EACC1-associated type [Nocardia brasiliensis]|uniref:caspase, EACC1-associated type n=1 Tax=Nocardia brasiliensis TaxID=37326 RepID=UPI001893EDAF|nr:AAA domain-containing protein [Nocardia brasiliensis]MBF6544558.1 caspase family protein [Nocardia brasiliensis]
MTRPAVRRALLVGIGSYADSHFAALPCTRTDVETFRAVLVDPKIGSFDEVTTLFDPEVSALRQGLRDFLEHSTKDELTMVYISGHGCREPKTAEFHFIARDTRHNEFESAVSAGFLNDLLDDCPARQRVLVIDCCNSGGFTTGFATTKAASAQGAAPLATRGVYVLASSQSAEASFPGENPGDPSIFTGELIDALRSGAGDQDRDGRVAVDELYHHVHRALTARESGRRQTPVMSAVGVAGAIYLASAPLIRSVARPRERTGTHLDQPRVVSHRSEWERLISYYRDCLQAENADAARLSFAARSTAAVFLGGPERFLSGNGMDDDGALPAPPQLISQLQEAAGKAVELVYGYPVVVLFADAERTQLREPTCAPLLIRDIEVIDTDSETPRLRPYGEPRVNPALAAQLLDRDAAEALLSTYQPEWGPADRSLMTREIRNLLREEFELPWVEDIDPDRLQESLEVATPRSGARNIGVLLSVPTDKTIRKLLDDLNDISRNTAAIGGTALDTLLDPSRAAEVVAEQPPAPVILGPMNDAQSDILAAAMTQRLTVATGPPGTGKSALIVNIVATAVAHGQRVLVASTNNTAVDEVWQRCEAAIPGLMIRTGSAGTGERLNYRAAEKQSLLAAATADRQTSRSRTTYQAEHAHVCREYADVRQMFTDHAKAERELFAAGAARAEARAALAAAAEFPAELDDTALIRIRNQAAKLEKARFFATWRRRNFLARWGITATKEQAAQLCEHLHAYVAAELRWREELPHAQTPDSDLAHRWVRSEEALSAASSDLVSATLDDLRASGRAALQQLAEDGDYRTEWKRRSDALAAAPAWAVTCLSARLFRPTPGLFDLVIIDESSQCSIAAVLPVLLRAERALIIGDPLQLPHVAKLAPATEARIRDEHGLDGDRLIDAHLNYRRDSAFHAFEHARSGSLLLNEHYRCHPDIAGLADRIFYAPRGKPLTILTDVAKHQRTNQPAVQWIDEPGRARRDANSWINEAEAERALRGVDFLRNALPAGATIGVVTPFARQAALIRRKLRGVESVRVGTAHTFQGGECDAIIFSLVAADGIGSGALAFLDAQANLWNVAITRARAHLFIVGSSDFWVRRGGLGRRLHDEIAAARGDVAWRHGDDLRDLLHQRLKQDGCQVDLAVRRSGYVMDALITTGTGAETAVVLDTGAATAQEFARHLRLQQRRAALLTAPGTQRKGYRLPAWRLFEPRPTPQVEA